MQSNLGMTACDLQDLQYVHNGTITVVPFWTVRNVVEIETF